jgi:hypothetical protein
VRTGNFTGLGTPLGGALTLLSGNVKERRGADGSLISDGPFLDAFRAEFRNLRQGFSDGLAGLGRTFGNIFKLDGAFGQTLGKLAGVAGGGAAVGGGGARSVVPGPGICLGAPRRALPPLRAACFLCFPPWHDALALSSVLLSCSSRSSSSKCLPFPLSFSSLSFSGASQPPRRGRSQQRRAREAARRGGARGAGRTRRVFRPSEQRRL